MLDPKNYSIQYIHPYDVMTLINNKDVDVKERGKCSVPVIIDWEENYRHDARILEINGLRYIETTTVQPRTVGGIQLSKENGCGWQQVDYDI